MPEKVPPSGDDDQFAPLDPAGLEKFKQFIAVGRKEKKVDPDVELWRQQRIKVLGQETRHEVEGALQLSVNILQGAEHAPRLAEVHNASLASPEFIIALEALSGNAFALDALVAALQDQPQLQQRLLAARNNPAEARKLLEELFALGGDHGFFVSHYSDEYERQRLENPNFVITEGTIPHPTQPGKSLAIADTQVEIPSSGVQKPIFDVPGQPSDVIYDNDLLNYALGHPDRVGVMQDIRADRLYDNKGYAGKVRDWNFAHIRNNINPQRQGHDITQVVAAIAGLQGIERPDGSRVMVNEHKNQGLLLNYRSIIAHQMSRYRAQLAYYLDMRPVPFRIGSLEYKILTRWFMHFQPINAAK